MGGQRRFEALPTESRRYSRLESLRYGGRSCAGVEHGTIIRGQDRPAEMITHELPAGVNAFGICGVLKFVGQQPCQFTGLGQITKNSKRAQDELSDRVAMNNGRQAVHQSFEVNAAETFVKRAENK